MSSRMRVALVLGIVMGAFAAVGTASAASDVVISQVYGAGGNVGALRTHDYVELYNRGPLALPLGNLSIQYASATGTGNFGSSSTQLTELPDFTLQPGQYSSFRKAAPRWSATRFRRPTTWTRLRS